MAQFLIESILLVAIANAKMEKKRLRNERMNGNNLIWCQYYLIMA
jgi:hypothetical protein